MPCTVRVVFAEAQVVFVQRDSIGSQYAIDLTLQENISNKIEGRGDTKRSSSETKVIFEHNALLARLQWKQRNRPRTPSIRHCTTQNLASLLSTHLPCSTVKAAKVREAQLIYTQALSSELIPRILLFSAKGDLGCSNAFYMQFPTIKTDDRNSMKSNT